ncbi:hypothetical protein BU14_0033s0014 [Porphyra umbilicalis]|uniref:Uncharacterized protein n=1 Tax=Porphyra umbilicalis TaxID=2786 RepID=A0A1X6PIK8_PORUM|nr:hypothetical protein BU14_0033s0014 [Porphyra umbilicalis]|eukprot:OSX80670.1 hypothetical protein BU14_0033s0014 [Porphyra umbilicalis]
MGLPGVYWLSHLENHEQNCDAPRKVELGLIDARYARKCEIYWASDKDANAKYLNHAVSNYKSAAAYFREAYAPETTPHIYQALDQAMTAADDRAVELEQRDFNKPSHGCQCDVCRQVVYRCPVHPWF